MFLSLEWIVLILPFFSYERTINSNFKNNYDIYLEVIVDSQAM